MGEGDSVRKEGLGEEERERGRGSEREKLERKKRNTGSNNKCTVVTHVYM